MKINEQVWKIIETYGNPYTSMDKYGNVWESINFDGNVWKHIEINVNVLQCTALYGQRRANGACC